MSHLDPGGLPIAQLVAFYAAAREGTVLGEKWSNIPLCTAQVVRSEGNPQRINAGPSAQIALLLIMKLIVNILIDFILSGSCIFPLSLLEINPHCVYPWLSQVA